MKLPLATTVFVLALSVNCAPANDTPAAPAGEPAALSQPPPLPSASAVETEASRRAQALIDDLHRRQVAQAKFDRENPPPPPPRLEDFQRAAAMPAPTALAPLPPAAITSTAASSDVPAGGGRDEAWWKNEMRTREVALDDELARHRAAQLAAESQVLQRTYDEALREVAARAAAVANAHAAVERLRDDARRANVPPGWLRWQ